LEHVAIVINLFDGFYHQGIKRMGGCNITAFLCIYLISNTSEKTYPMLVQSDFIAVGH